MQRNHSGGTFCSVQIGVLQCRRQATLVFALIEFVFEITVGSEYVFSIYIALTPSSASLSQKEAEHFLNDISA